MNFQMYLIWHKSYMTHFTKFFLQNVSSLEDWSDLSWLQNYLRRNIFFLCLHRAVDWVSSRSTWSKRLQVQFVPFWGTKQLTQKVVNISVKVVDMTSKIHPSDTHSHWHQHSKSSANFTELGYSSRKQKCFTFSSGYLMGCKLY